MTKIRFCLTISVMLWVGFVSAGGAEILYDLDFEGVEVGSYQTVFGTPTVAASKGPFEGTLVFDALAGYEQIQLRINNVAPRYEVDYDVFMSSGTTGYKFTIFFDTPSVRTLSYWGSNFIVDLPHPEPDFWMGSYDRSLPHHVGIVFDLEHNVWTVALDGVERFSHAINATELRSIRLSMGPYYLISGRDHPGEYAALDNLIVRAVPEPGAAVLLLLGLPAVGLLRRRGNQVLSA